MVRTTTKTDKQQAGAVRPVRLAVPVRKRRALRRLLAGKRAA